MRAVKLTGSLFALALALPGGCIGASDAEKDAGGAPMLRPLRRAVACPATSRVTKATLSSVPLAAPGDMPTAVASVSPLGAEGEVLRVLMSTAKTEPVALEEAEPGPDEVRVGVGVRSFDAPVVVGEYAFASDEPRQVFAEARRAGHPTGVLTPGPAGRPQRNEHGQLRVTWIDARWVCGRFSFGHANGRFEGRFRARRADRRQDD